MPISFLDKNFGSTFFSLLDSTKKQIRIISPFVGYKTALALVDFIEEAEEDIECVIITRFDREDFIKGVSSLAGLERLIKVGVNIFALQGLHTKLYIFDGESVIMGSANFTFNGFYRNHEFGVFMEKEKQFSKECNSYFDGLLNDIANTGNWKVSIEQIEKEKPYCNDAVTDRASSQKKPRKNESPITIQPNLIKWGAKLDSTNEQLKGTEENDFLEDILNNENEGEVHKRNTGIWLKFEGNSENRIPNHLTYFERRKREHHKRTFFPKSPSGIKQGQILFMTMVSTDSYNNGTPIIVGYAITSGYDEKNVITGTMSLNSKDRERYPYYVELVGGRFLKAPIREGISLRELARELQGGLYPNPKANFNEIIYTHRQKSHLQITERAHDYIMERLNTLFAVHGFDEL
ncbi:phospholipase D-like domain-containing protein [Paenibacillus odorifer]|uniref:phospholipase D-like domain-containing protein n=1 Tax=Paenibacillus odorifer TaxID=189426 RepID=UPI000BA060D3|nr:phospholipase D-like domain-containing protein [Paenibacillus odorifer]OZQ73883.1 NgoFVII family restriction endonuclease [Paenibacillus odorifer]